MSGKTVIVIGAGPVGLAAAAHLVEQGLTPVVVEAGAHAGAAISQWSHIRLFSPWRFNIDPAARRILAAAGWAEPNPHHLPTGGEFVERYLKPLAARLAKHIRYGTRVIAVSRDGVDKTRTIARNGRRYVVRVRNGRGGHRDLFADAVIDASGTWGNPNPLGAHGLVAAGEQAAADFVSGPLPDVIGRDRDRFACKHVMVVGMGHSAANTLINLVELARDEPETRITWAIRAGSPTRLYGGGDADELAARGRLGTRVKALVDDGTIGLVRRFAIDELVASDRVTVVGRQDGEPTVFDVDVIVPATGFRPDMDILREVRLDLDPGMEAPARLAPLIDPNFHSCGTVPPHGESILAHPDDGFYLVGMKSYGRAPTFLMATGYEQVRSIAAALSGDRVAADTVALDLPETGVCSSGPVAEDALGNVRFAGSCCPTTADSGGTVASTCSPSTAGPLIGRGFATGLQHGRSSETADADSNDSCCSPQSVSSG